MQITEERIEKVLNNELIQVFTSRGRVKIIVLMAKEIELNISEIVERCKLNHKSTFKHLQFLTNAGILQEKQYGRIRIYRFRLEEYRNKALRNLVEVWE